MAEWLVEEGIGEDRAIQLHGGTIRAARIDWQGGLAAGTIAEGRLVAKAAGSTRGTVRFVDGEEALVDRLPRNAAEGSTLLVEVTRAAIAERGRTKLPQARPSAGPPSSAPTLAERLRSDGHQVQVVRRFPACDWDELVAEAWDGELVFPGGSLTVSPTPAMTLIDIDGTGDPLTLAKSAVGGVARAIARFELAGSIGIDFPTLAAKADRHAVDAALAETLVGWPHERTAMNGFGFIQLVARLTGPSLVARLARDRAGAGARMALRRAEGVKEPGAVLVSVHPAAQAAVKPEWATELARRTGREVRWHIDPAVALNGGFAQAIAL